MKLVSYTGQIGTIAVLLLNPCRSTSAQITPDHTLPHNSNVILNSNSVRIEGGSQVGGNLFHSFTEFSVNVGTEAFFNNSLDIQNIFTRVTGNTASNINGLIRANGSANLFFINPNGITFGPHAALNIGGSFIGTTANNIKFADGTQFSTKPANLPSPLLTISVPIGLQFGINPGQIINQSTVSIPNISQPVGLAVQPGQTLALAGGDILLQGGILTAQGGRIELSAVGDHNSVSLTPIPNGQGFILGNQDLQNLRDIQLSGGAVVNTSGSGGGDIQLQGRQVSLQNGSSLLAVTLGNLPGGTIKVNASQSLDISGIGDYEDIVRKFVNATVGISDLHSGLFTLTFGPGNGGNIVINTPQLTEENGAFIDATTLAPGKGGTIVVNASSISLNAAFITTGTSGLNAGDSGDITVNTNHIVANNNGFITAVSVGNGQAGNLSVNARESIELIGVNPFQITENVDGYTGFFTSGLGTGKSGNIQITTKKLSMFSGADIAAGVFAAGEGGNININATGSVELSGRSPNGYSMTDINTLTTPGSTGGNLFIQTPSLTLQNGAMLNVRSQGTGSPFNLQVVADTIKIFNQSRIEGTAIAGEGANINLQANTLQIAQNSFISATAGFLGATRNGGNINITTNTLGLLANSSIFANAFSGKGGNITITTKGNFISTDSNITASSTLGVSGTVKINTLNSEPTSGLFTFSTKFSDLNSQIIPGCAADRGNLFIITGRGGLPKDQTQNLTSLARENISKQEGKSLSNRAAIFSSKPLMVEATRWTIDSHGQVKLVANADKWTHQYSWYTFPKCPKKELVYLLMRE